MKLKLAVILCLCYSFNAYSANYSFVETLVWTELKPATTIEKTASKYFYFTTAEMNADKGYLPEFSKRFRISNSDDISNVRILKAVYETIQNIQGEDILGLDYITNDIEIENYYTISRKERFGTITFIPIRRNRNTGELERLVSFELSVETKKQAQTATFNRLTNQKAASNSVLAQGEWYKIGVTRDAAFKISYNLLENMGVDMSLVTPANIRLFGNGGGMLPEPNSEFRYDDLQENAIQVFDGGDGSFDKKDYFVFYGESPNQWDYLGNSRYRHETHRYSDTTFYFLNFDQGPGKRITILPSSSSSPNYTVTTFDDYEVHDVDQVNLVKSGRTWFGEVFDAVTSYNFNFNFPNISTSDTAYLRVRVAAKSQSNSSFKVQSGGKSIDVPVDDVDFTYPSPGGSGGSGELQFVPTSSSLNVSVSYTKPLSTSRGWLDFLEFNVRRRLNMNGIQMNFRDHKSIGSGRVSEFVLRNASSNLTIWDVTNPLNVRQQSFTLNSANEARFITPTTELKKYIAFSELITDVYPKGRVQNQNLHALDQKDYIIVTHPLFKTQAEILAAYHENEGLRTVVVTTNQVFNEFSSGCQDLVGIRDFVRMFYQRATIPSDLPSYLLMFGDASYDLKDRISGNTNFVPSYQSRESFSLTSSYVSDDYFGLLDTNEGSWLFDEDVDLGVGRIPVKTVEEAEAVVNKILHYKDPVTMRDWRNLTVFIGDDEDNRTHMGQAEDLSKTVAEKEPVFNANKIFLDAYKQVSTPGGQRYPSAEEAINRQMEQGALILNYTGHGGETGWAKEQIIEISDINAWENFESLPLFVTATCEFSRFDDPKRVSGGEYVLLNPKGGGIALFTTVRTVYSGDNFNLNTRLYENIFRIENNEHLRMGDVFRAIKNIVNTSNTRNFTLLGDPALKLNFPELNVVTTAINDMPISTVDTINALEKMTIKGYVADLNGNKMNNYNGLLYPTIFDKKQLIKTLNNDGEGSFSFDLQSNKLFKGKVSIKNGEFSFSFIVPKDINYEFGKGKISLYGQNEITDANGFDTNFVIGGTSSSAVADNMGPEIELYMNDETFIYGGITDENPIFLAKLSDQHGINMVGTGLGHDIIATLDKNTDQAIVLNDFYEADIDSYQSGSINYPFSGLSEGNHTLTLKAWDVYNNSSEATIEFVVEKSKEIEIANVLNYPNPFTTRTEFWFEHNQPSRVLDVKIQIFTVSGKLIKTIDRLVQTEGYSQNQINPITWNGRDDYGDKIGRGVYLYKLIVRSRGNGSIAEKIEKLVIL